MANAFTKVANKIVYSMQEMFNQSFDADFNQNAVEILAYDPTSNVLQRAYPSMPLNLKPYDYVSRSLNSATETWTFKSGGSSGTTTNTVVIVYTDTTLATISTVTKT